MPPPRPMGDEQMSAPLLLCAGGGAKLCSEQKRALGTGVAGEAGCTPRPHPRGPGPRHRRGGRGPLSQLARLHAASTPTSASTWQKPRPSLETPRPHWLGLLGPRVWGHWLGTARGWSWPPPTAAERGLRGRVGTPARGDVSGWRWAPGLSSLASVLGFDVKPRGRQRESRRWSLPAPRARSPAGPPSWRPSPNGPGQPGRRAALATHPPLPAQDASVFPVGVAQAGPRGSWWPSVHPPDLSNPLGLPGYCSCDGVFGDGTAQASRCSTKASQFSL